MNHTGAVTPHALPPAARKPPLLRMLPILLVLAVAQRAGPAAAAQQAQQAQQDAAPPAGRAAAWLTTADRTLLLARQPDVPLGAAAVARTPWSPGVETAGAPPAGPHTIDIDLARPAQPILGFGATLSAASAWLLQQRLGRAARESLLDELFGRQGGGLGLGLARLYLGASEFARGRYTYGDSADGADDPALAQVTLAPDRDTVIALAQQALARNPALEFIARPPPRRTG